MRVDVVALVGDLAACDPATADRDELVASVEASARVRAWLDGFDVEVGRALEVKTGYGAKVFADAANVSLAARRAGDRAWPHVGRAARDRGRGAGPVTCRVRMSMRRLVRCVRSTRSAAVSSRRSSMVWWVMRGRCPRTSSSGD